MVNSHEGGSKTINTEIMNGREAAEFLKVGKSTLYSLAKKWENTLFLYRYSHAFSQG